MSARVRTRRLSPLRLSVAVVVTASVITGGTLWGTAAISNAITPTVSPWFAGYVDVTATPAYAFETPINAADRSVVLGFVVADAANTCTPTWGAAYTLDQAGTSLDLDRRIARLTRQGGQAVVSFGGQANTDLSLACTSASSLQSAYAAVINRYSLSAVDLDLEGATLAPAAVARGALAIAAEQKARHAAGHDLAVWLTLPVTPTGLDPTGTDAVAAYLAAGVKLTGVNAMTMDYGTSLTAGTTMLAGSESALTNVQRQLGVLYSRADISLSSKTLWSKVGATPMIGQNDSPGEVFSLAAASALNRFARTNGMGRMSAWSLNRDASCGPNYVNITTVSGACSGVNQGSTSFATVLAASLKGHPDTATATSTPEPTAIADDPATSPYAIWSATGIYLTGTKTVWHHNVYQAKWWTSGDVPDAPVLQTYETPWQLLGPVLPGEKPVVLPTVPAGTYPTWDGDTTFNVGDRVLLDGIAYAAKWWTRGDSPAAASADPDSSPWVALTTAQVLAVIASPPK